MFVRIKYGGFWEKRGRTWRKSIENVMEKTRGEEVEHSYNRKNRPP